MYFNLLQNHRIKKKAQAVKKCLEIGFIKQLELNNITRYLYQDLLICFLIV